MPDELPALELYRYRAHTTPTELHDYRTLRYDIGEKGIREPVQIATDGQYAILEDGHKRVCIAIELCIDMLPVKIVRRQFSAKRRVKWPIGTGLAELLNPQPAPTVQEAEAAT
jgi:hypothetical protein